MRPAALVEPWSPAVSGYKRPQSALTLRQHGPRVHEVPAEEGTLEGRGALRLGASEGYWWRMGKDDLKGARVRAASSKNVSCGESEVIHETTKQRVSVMAFFVDRAARETSFKKEPAARRLVEGVADLASIDPDTVTKAVASILRKAERCAAWGGAS